KQSDPSKNKAVACGSSTTGYREGQIDSQGRWRVYDEATAAVGTTTSYDYVWDGSDWQKAKGDTSGYTYVIGTGNVTVNALPNVTVATGSVNIINEPDIDIQKVKGTTLPIAFLPTNSALGCSNVNMVDTVATTTATLITGVAGQSIYLIGIRYYSRAATAGNITFSWSGGATCYPSAVSGSIGAGFIDDQLYLVGPVSEGLRITTPAAFSTIIFYLQQ
ncbi:MAG: hypothetical protein ACOYWZ_16065, partial [Bacillota bacterium]